MLPNNVIVDQCVAFSAARSWVLASPVQCTVRDTTGYAFESSPPKSREHEGEHEKLSHEGGCRDTGDSSSI